MQISVNFNNTVPLNFLIRVSPFHWCLEGQSDNWSNPEFKTKLLGLTLSPFTNTIHHSLSCYFYDLPWSNKLQLHLTLQEDMTFLKTFITETTTRWQKNSFVNNTIDISTSRLSQLAVRFNINKQLHQVDQAPCLSSDNESRNAELMEQTINW